MAEERKSEDVKFYLERVAESSKRSRVVLYLLLFSSALIFAYNWKTRPGNWVQSRIDVRREIVANWTNLPISSNDLQGLQRTVRATDWDYLMVAETNFSDTNISDTNLYHWREKAGLDWLKWRHPNPTMEDVSNRLKDLEGEGNSWGVFKEPLLDITFDDNDFVLFSALELLVLGVVFLYCLLREEQNLDISFKYAGTCGAQPEFYTKASMEQVWNNSDGERKLSQRAFYSIPYLLLMIPVAVEVWGFKVDIELNRIDLMSWFHDPGKSPFSSWDILNRPLGRMQLCFEWILILCLTATMLSAMVVFFRMNRMWKRAALEADQMIAQTEIPSMPDSTD